MLSGHFVLCCLMSLNLVSTVVPDFAISSLAGWLVAGCLGILFCVVFYRRLLECLLSYHRLREQEPGAMLFGHLVLCCLLPLTFRMSPAVPQTSRTGVWLARQLLTGILKCSVIGFVVSPHNFSRQLYS